MKCKHCEHGWIMRQWPPEHFSHLSGEMKWQEYFMKGNKISSNIIKVDVDWIQHQELGLVLIAELFVSQASNRCETVRQTLYCPSHVVCLCRCTDICRPAAGI